MFQSRLFNYIIDKANEVRNEFGCEALYASHIAVAVADFCQKEYTGFSFLEGGHPRYEDERLRYLFAKEVKLTSFFRICCKRNAKAGIIEEMFSVEDCNRIVASRKDDILSADVLFLCALRALHPSYRQNLKTVSSEESILALLQDTDQNIYDFVIDKVEEICSKLKKRVEEAEAIRDWKPARKFAEPEEVLVGFFEKIGKETSEKEMTLKLSKFFGSADLKLSAHQVGDIYYIHDNGCAIRHLSRRLGDRKKCERALKKVCHSCWIYNGRITGSFASAVGFFEYLKSVVFVAHADLYYTKLDSYLIPKEKGYTYIGLDCADLLEGDTLISLLKEGISCYYDENEGLCLWADAKCSLSSGRLAFLIETMDETLRISDRRKGKREGEIFENFYWDNEDILPYKKYIERIAVRFGAYFEDRDLYLTEKTGSFNKAIYKFFNLSVLISEFGHNIALPKIRGKVR